MNGNSDTKRGAAENAKFYKEQFREWRGIGTEGMSPMQKMEHMKAGVQIAIDLAADHTSRETPGLFARMARGGNAREYAEEREVLNAIVDDLKSRDPNAEVLGAVSAQTGMTLTYDQLKNRDVVNRLREERAAPEQAEKAEEPTVRTEGRIEDPEFTEKLGELVNEEFIDAPDVAEEAPALAPETEMRQ